MHPNVQLVMLIKLQSHPVLNTCTTISDAISSAQPNHVSTDGAIFFCQTSLKYVNCPKKMSKDAKYPIGFSKSISSSDNCFFSVKYR